MRKAVMIVPALLIAQAALVHWAAASERPPAIPDLSTFPGHAGAWQVLREDPIAPDVRAQLQADQLLSRTYSQPANGTAASLLVAWFQTQSQGNRQPHSPQVCLPGAGWTPLVTDRIPIQAGGETLSINRYVAAYGGQRAVILYWYQTSRRVVASEWASKFWTVWDALSARRTDIALVRVVTWPSGPEFETATAEGAAFAKEIYPMLRESFPQ
jgi:EpsI family protein